MKQFKNIYKKILLTCMLAAGIATAPQLHAQISANQVPGYVDSTMIRCYVDMATVDFNSTYKFKTNEVNGTNNRRIQGFTIPLVGDLNGDGKPEIVAQGVRDNSDGVVATYIYVINGQTGEEIVRYPMPMEWYTWLDGYHDSPGHMALVDADRNGKAEIIVAYGAYYYYGSSPNETTARQYDKRIVSYEVNDNTFNPSVSTSSPTKLTQKWITADKYDTPNTTNSYFHKPVTQVLDIDGDGIPEVSVYNKIYNAQTGALLMTLDNLIHRDNPTSTSAANDAFVGLDQIMDVRDDELGFPFFYDLDFDGKHEFIAGGKVYCDLNLTTGSYTVIRHPDLYDAHTSVCDINDDGIPDIINSAWKPGTTPRNMLRIAVWDPGLVTRNGAGKIVAGNRTPRTLAIRDVPTYTTGSGNHSYVYVGDIDGKLQNGKKFPEISVLGPPFFLTNGWNATVPVHPNVAGQLPANFAYSEGTGVGSSTGTATGRAVQGAIISLTWDDNATAIEERLKLSFLLEHNDNSVNTGFTLFDFDNDGIQDISYRDETTLRIISAAKPLVRVRETKESSPDVIKFKEEVRSYTGFEYPVTADVDGDYSTDMIVVGQDIQGYGIGMGFIFAVESKSRDFAPSRRVWNQFMYSPLKINEDLTTPLVNIHPLDSVTAFYRPGEDVASFIFNNTLTQTPQFSTFKEVKAPGDTVLVMKPIVMIPDAVLKNLSVDLVKDSVFFSIANTGNAALNAQSKIQIYKDGVSAAKSYYSFPVGGSGIYPGETKQYKFKIKAPADRGSSFTIRVTDNSFISGAGDIFMYDSSVNDCNWATNVDSVSTFLPKGDALTVMQYGTATVDVLANDILDICTASDIQLTEAMLTTPKGPGSNPANLRGDFGEVKIVNNKLQYTAPSTYPGNVVTLSYTLTCGGFTKSANVSIFVMETCSGTSVACAGSLYNICLKQDPADLLFDWYDKDSVYLSTTAPTLDNPAVGTVTYYAKPNYKKVTGSPYRMIDFPVGEVTTTILPSDGSQTLKWTGAVDTDWNNPNNWVQPQTVGGETQDLPVSYVPTSCVNVILAKGASNYPELSRTSKCLDLHLEDRAMIAGVHNLDYQSAGVELILKPEEKDRFLMWSAPLKDVYTGDYHFKQNGQPSWGNVYMNFFQMKNPDYASSVAKENTLTATFGSVGTALSLGTAFTTKVTNPNTNATLLFPQSATTYTDAKGTTVTGLGRTNAARFITDGVLSTTTGILDLPVNGDNDYKMIHVPNPFMAYLNMNKFLTANSGVLENSYKLWDGDVNSNYVSVIALATDTAQRLVIDDTAMPSATGAFIPPLKSFFVMKKTKTDRIQTLRITPDMLTTSNGSSSSYTLRSAEAEAETKTLRIRASQNGYENMTVLLNQEGAVPAYKGDEDSYKLFNEESPVAVYTLSPSKDPLAINSNGDFSSNVRLGVRLAAAGTATLDFTGVKAFGYTAYLIDHEQADKMISLDETPTYAFTVETAPASGQKIELNERFSLHFETRATGIETVDDSGIRVSVDNRTILVESSTRLIDHVQVFSVSGELIYNSRKPAGSYKIKVASNRVYLVKTMVGDKMKVFKVIGK